MNVSTQATSVNVIVFINALISQSRPSFLDALASLDFKLSVSQSVSNVFPVLRLAHLRVFQSYFHRIDIYC